MRSKSEPKPMVACFDLVDTLHFLWSVAQARAVQEETKIVWQPYRDSSVLNGIYWVFRSYGTPGTAEVRQDSKRIEERTERYFNELIDKFLLRAADNSHPLSLGTWMSVQKDIRDYALESVQETFRDAAGINQEVVEGTAKV